ncbi:ATP-binding protein [Thermococcus sp. LS2]|uniref:AAA family ATPase n=1 Tax=Thermococcus sp. LS2 TaxID=1638260 RepID=UPI0014391827|nr:ATP-binding protein [Thermococcus sp. LS2]NJE13754.1 ATP-binding protein [Thermococcus sp. LS2]
MTLCCREYESWILKNLLGEHFIIVHGPRWSGKSYFVQKVLESTDWNYIIIDAHEAWKEKKSWLERKIVSDIVESAKQDKPLGAVKDIRGVSLSTNNIKNFDDVLESIDDDVYFVFDHAEFLRFARGVDFRESFQDKIDERGNIHFIFVPRGTGELIKWLGPRDPDSPLFMRYERYIDIDYFSPHDSVNFLENEFERTSIEHDLNELFEAYRFIGGSPVWLKRYSELRVENSPEKALKLLAREVCEKVQSELGKMGRSVNIHLRVLQTIARKTPYDGYTDLKTVYKTFGKKRNEVDKYLKNLIDRGYLKIIFHNAYAIALPIVHRCLSTNIE